MTTELALYISVVTFSFLCVFLNKKPIWVVISYLLCAAFMWEVRRVGFDIDMKGYAAVLHYNFSFDASSTYYAREFVYWFGASYLFQIINNEQITFWVIDLVWLFLLHKGLWSNHTDSPMPLYTIPFLVIFFPALMGYENVYRQLIACMVVIYAFFGTKRVISASLIAFLALFIHNAAIIYLPFLYLYSATKGFSVARVKNLNKLIFAFSYIVVIGGVYYTTLGDTEFGKSSSSTGLSLSFAYALVFVAMLFMSLYMARFRFSVLFKRHFYIVYSFLTFLLCVPILGPAQAERIGMMLLMISAPMFIKELDRNFRHDNEKIIIRFLFVLCGAAPTFLFPSAFYFLLTSQR